MSQFKNKDQNETREIINNFSKEQNIKLAIEELKHEGNYLEENVKLIAKNYSVDFCELEHLVIKNQTFKNVGYFRDYYIKIGCDLKFLTTEVDVKKDREILGYYGRNELRANCDFIVNKKVIKEGTVFITELREAQGKKLNQFKN